MTSFSDAIGPDEVNRHLMTNLARYQQTLARLSGIFRDYKFSRKSRGAIYAIYSRGDRQGGCEFKEAWKIAAKLAARRNEAPGYPLQDVPDIIGLTVVVVYPSDIDVVCRFVDGNRAWQVVKKKPRNQDGYRAFHYELRLQDPQYSGVRCEVQVKTMLNDAWSAKTHDLTYKPRGLLVPQFLVAQFGNLSDRLHAIDRETEALKTEIEKAWQRHDARRDAARKSLISMAARTGGRMSTKRQKRFERLRRKLEKGRKRFAGGRPSAILAELEVFALEAPCDRYTCLLFALLAAMRAENDLDELALDYGECPSGC